MAEDRVERLLIELAPDIAYPRTPDLRAAVRRRIEGRSRPWLAVVLVAAAVAAAIATEAAIAGYLELKGATIQHAPRLPSPSASVSPLPPGDAGTRLKLGSAYQSVREARQAAGFDVLEPEALGRPDGVHYTPAPGVVTLVYGPRPGLPATADPEVGALVMEARASVDQMSFGKLAGPGTRVEPLTVNGGQGFWISGAPHGFFFYRSGAGQPDEFRLAGDVLIWNQGALVIRIESSLPKDRVLEIARTMSPPPV